VYAYQFDGVHYDAGDKFGYLQASIAYALKDPETAQPLLKHLAGFAGILASREKQGMSA
jgi:UTP--glucose-1-phosphate uridylyltransferase